MAKCFFPYINRKHMPADKFQQGKLLGHGEDDDGGKMTVKIVVTKKELKHLIAAMNERERIARHRRQRMAPQSLEQLFSVLRRRREKKQQEEVTRTRRGGWEPALQSIPEEIGIHE